MTVTIKADGSRLTAEQPVLADGTAGAVRVQFALDDSWAGLAVTVVFRTPRGDILMPLTDGACALPAEATEKCGNVLVGVFGTDGVRTLTSTFCRLRISQGVPTEGETAKNYTPGLYEQFAAKFARFENMTVDAVGGDKAGVTAETTGTAIKLHFTLPRGDKGEAPRIGDNGNWYVYDNATQKWVDTGVRAGGSADFAESDNTAPAYIRNRPFGVVEGVLAEQALHFTAAGDTYSCDAVTSAALVLGEKYRIIWDGMEYFCTAESNISGGGITITGNYLGNPAQFLTSGDMGDTGEPFFIAGNAGVAGISVFSTDGDTDHTIRIERVKLLHTGWLSETVVSKEYVQKELDAANTAIDALQIAVADLQYQEDETVETDILPQQELAFVDDDSLYFGTAPAISLIAGEQYIVVWDGVEYETTAVMYEAFGGNGIGNASLLGLGDDTGEPFAIGVIGETTCLSTSSTETAHTVRIYQLIVGSKDLPAVTEDDNDKILQVVGGKYTLVFVEDSVVKNYIDGYISEALGGEY